MKNHEIGEKLKASLIDDFRREMWPFRLMYGYSAQSQEAVIAEAYGSHGFNVDNAEKIAEFLASVNSIEWFASSGQTPHEFVQEQIANHLDALGLRREKIAVTLDWQDASSQRSSSAFKADWVAAWHGACRTVGQVAASRLPRAALELANSYSFESQDPVTNGAFAAAAQLSWEREPNAKQDAYQTLIGNARYLACERHIEMLKANPFAPLFELYRRGMWPVGLRRKLLGTEFLVYG